MALDGMGDDLDSMENGGFGDGVEPEPGTETEGTIKPEVSPADAGSLDDLPIKPDQNSGIASDTE